jgi:hypothetical protein
MNFSFTLRIQHRVLFFPSRNVDQLAIYCHMRHIDLVDITKTLVVMDRPGGVTLLLFGIHRMLLIVRHPIHTWHPMEVDAMFVSPTRAFTSSGKSIVLSLFFPLFLNKGEFLAASGFGVAASGSLFF